MSLLTLHGQSAALHAMAERASGERAKTSSSPRLSFHSFAFSFTGNDKLSASNVNYTPSRSRATIPSKTSRVNEQRQSRSPSILSTSWDEKDGKPDGDNWHGTCTHDVTVRPPNRMSFNLSARRRRSPTFNVTRTFFSNSIHHTVCLCVSRFVHFLDCVLTMVSDGVNRAPSIGVKAKNLCVN